MNDELKNILDEFMNFDFNSQSERMEINEYERNILKDYITNLQQEIKEANDSITWWTNRFKAVERDNKELKEELEEEKRIEEADLKTIQQLEEENETRQQDINNLTYQLAKKKEENERLKGDNEFLKKEIIKLERKYLKGDLLNILQNGSEKE